MVIFKRQIIIALLILISSTGNIELFSQSVQSKPTRQSSLEAFSKGDFDLAYKEFSELLLTYSKDPVYKYYAGVCLVKLERDPENAILFLNQALQGATVVKSLPADVMFYLGRAQQLTGKYEDADNSYRTYSDQVGKKTAREKGVPDLIQQCSERRGAISKAEVIAAPENIYTKPTEEEPVQQPAAKQFPLSKTELPSGYESILNEAMEFQFKADSLINLTAQLKKEIEKLPQTSQEGLKLRIAANEQLAASFQKIADSKYDEAHAAMNPETKPQKLISTDIQQAVVLKDTLSESKDTEVKKSIPRPETVENKEPAKQADALVRTEQPKYTSEKTFAIFKILPEPVTSPDVKIAINPEVPEGLIYRIQVAVFRNTVAPVYFKGIEPVFGFKVSGTDRTNYYAGMFRRSADAKKALVSIKAKGFKDAFVIAFLGSKSVSADRAAILEKEWGNKPFVNQITSQEIPVDTVPPTLSFRVEIVRSAKPLEDDVVSKISKLAGNRGFDIISLDDGSIVYLIGKFITFESAAEFADLIVRNGYREARVGAWLGRREIPVETARQLFDSLQ